VLYEPKWDGFRAIVYRDGDELILGSRNERPMTRYFPELVETIRTHLPRRCVVDGEIVIVPPSRFAVEVFDCLRCGGKRQVLAGREGSRRGESDCGAPGVAHEECEPGPGASAP